jgi:hypothetical protein
MPLSEVEARRFTEIAKSLGVAPNKIPAMIKLAGEIVDKNQLTGVQHMKVANSDFVGVVKESYRIWITPDFRAENKAIIATMGEALLLIFVIALALFLLRPLIKDTLGKLPEWMEEIKKSTGAF